MERIAELVGLRIVGALTAVSFVALRVLSLRRLLELRVDLSQCFLADLAHTPRR